MPREAIWTSIAATLTAEVAEGLYKPGDRLPTEAELALRFGVNRHTIRRALAALADAGLVHARRGSGVFVAARPTDYRLGRRVRFHQNLIASGRTPSRRITRLETRVASAIEADALRIGREEMVHVIEGVSMADGQPLATFQSVFPAARFPGLLAEMNVQTSVTVALAACGLADYTRAETRLTARLADPVLAMALQVQPQDPILQSVAINVDASGNPIEFGTTSFAGDRVALTLNAES